MRASNEALLKRAFREQEDDQAARLPLSSSLVFLL